MQECTEGRRGEPSRRNSRNSVLEEVTPVGEVGDSHPMGSLAMQESPPVRSEAELGPILELLLDSNEPHESQRSFQACGISLGACCCSVLTHQPQDEPPEQRHHEHQQELGEYWLRGPQAWEAIRYEVSVITARAVCGGASRRHHPPKGNQFVPWHRQPQSADTKVDRASGWSLKPLTGIPGEGNTNTLG